MRAALALLALSVAGCGPDPARVLIARGDVRLWEGEVEVARSEADRRRGLADHAGLGPGQGLVLEAPVEDELCVTNAPVSFAIDAAFADGEGSIVAVERAVPAGDGSPRCHRRARWILETAAGELEPVREGDTLESDALGL